MLPNVRYATYSMVVKLTSESNGDFSYVRKSKIYVRTKLVTNCILRHRLIVEKFCSCT